MPTAPSVLLSKKTVETSLTALVDAIWELKKHIAECTPDTEYRTDCLVELQEMKDAYHAMQCYAMTTYGIVHEMVDEEVPGKPTQPV